MYKRPQPWSAFGSWDDEKVYAVVTGSTVRSLNAGSTTCSRHFWTVQRRCVCGKRQGFSTPAKSDQKPEGFARFPKRMAGVGHLKRICKDGFRVAGAVQETYSSEILGGQRWFPERGCILEHQIFRFAKMILRDRCSTLYDLASLFSWQAQYFRQMEWKNRKTHWHEAVSSAFNFPFLKEVSQNSFVFDVVKFKHWGWGSLAELLRFWCCHLRKWRKPCRLASFSCCPRRTWRKPCKIASLSILPVHRETNR